MRAGVLLGTKGRLSYRCFARARLAAHSTVRARRCPSPAWCEVMRWQLRWLLSCSEIAENIAVGTALLSAEPACGPPAPAAFSRHSSPQPRPTPASSSRPPHYHQLPITPAAAVPGSKSSGARRPSKRPRSRGRPTAWPARVPTATRATRMPSVSGSRDRRREDGQRPEMRARCPADRGPSACSRPAQSHASTS
jgi:hypothetical protein